MMRQSMKYSVIVFILVYLASCGGPKASAELGGEWTSDLGITFVIDFKEGTLSWSGDAEIEKIELIDDRTDSVRFQFIDSKKSVVLRRIDDDEATYTADGQQTIVLRRMSVMEQINRDLK